MAIYKVRIYVNEVYDDIEADSEDEAFEIACEAVLSGGDWGGDVELISEEKEEEEENDDDDEIKVDWFKEN